MRPRNGFEQAQLRLRLAACHYRIKAAGRSPYVQVYEARPPRRQQAARGVRLDNDDACLELVDLLLAADKDRRRGGAGLDWHQLAAPGLSAEQAPAGVGPTWGELRALILADIAPGGPKARDRNPFVCFGDRGYFGRTFSDAEPARPLQLEEFCLYTPASLAAHRVDPSQPLEKREYNAKGFYQVIQMVNYLARKGVAIATPELRQKLEGLKAAAGRQKAPKPRYIPRTEDIQDWLDQLELLDPFRGWVMATVATYGLRNHEIWHVDALPGEVPGNPRMISVGSFHGDAAGGDTKTGHRYALALPEEWLVRYRLNDLNHSQEMLRELRRRFPLRVTERSDGSVQFHNNGDLGRTLSHWFRNTAREELELPVKLFGWHEPRRIPGRPKPRTIRGRCRVYDLRHAWALRARETTTWSTALKAMAMGHSEAVHASRYLVAERAKHRLEGMNRQLALDEGRTHAPQMQRKLRVAPAVVAPAVPSTLPAELPADLSPELIELARKLKAAGLG